MNVMAAEISKLLSGPHCDFYFVVLLTYLVKLFSINSVPNILKKWNILGICPIDSASPRYHSAIPPPPLKKSWTCRCLNRKKVSNLLFAYVEVVFRKLQGCETNRSWPLANVFPLKITFNELII